MSAAEQVAEMQSQLKTKQQKTSELTGERAGVIKQLKDEGCKDLAQAEKEAGAEEEKATNYRATLKKEVAKLKDDYDWDDD